MSDSLVKAIVPSLSDLGVDGPLKYGSQGKAVRLLQEWLCIHGFHTTVDGDFGSATGIALVEFSNKNVSPNLVHHVVDNAVWYRLWHPMTKVLVPILPEDLAARQHYIDSLGKYALCHLALSHASVHLKYGAKEIGQNQGPWVRLYMDADPVNGHDGPEFSWCSSFVRFCIEQALSELGWTYTDGQLWDYITDSWSCDRVGNWADRNKRIGHGDSSLLVPGQVFLVRGKNFNKKNKDWVHTGFVLKHLPEQGVIETVEGNTSGDRSYNGTSVKRRYRAANKLDYVAYMGHEAT